MTPHTARTVMFRVNRNVYDIITKVAKHYGLSVASATAKLVELGIESLGEEFTRTSMDYDTGTNKRVIPSLRKQL